MTAHPHLAPVQRATVTPITENVFDRAMRIALSAGTDWGQMLACARTLSGSPDWRHVNLARHIMDAYTLHEAGLLKPVTVIHRDKSDMVDAWKGQAVTPEPDEPPAWTIRDELTAYAGLAVIVTVCWVLLRVVA